MLGETARELVALDQSDLEVAYERARGAIGAAAVL